MNKVSSSRAGNYIKQLAGYSAFVPSNLPPEPAIKLDEDLQKLLSEADRNLGRLDGAVVTLPNPDLFVFMYVRKEAVLSSQIEGTQSSLQDLLAAEANLYLEDQPKDVDEVINYVSAMNHGLSRLEELPVSVRLIKEIHERLLSGVRGSKLTPGQLRTSQNWIGPSGCSLMEAAFVPPPPDLVAECLGQLEKFLHAQSSLPLLIQIGLAHAQFETIHPFLDGNGRVGRLLITFLLCQQKVLQKPVLYLSHYFKQHRQEYYERLQSVRDKGDWEGWLTFFLQGVVQVAAQSSETARRILELREQHREIVTRQFKRATANGHLLLEYLYERPIISVNEIVKLTGASYPASNNLVEQFVMHGILTEITGQKRNRRYRYHQYVGLFDGHVDSR
jgi:Fic family protein